jgi:hypothetical protein
MRYFENQFATERISKLYRNVPILALNEWLLAAEWCVLMGHFHGVPTRFQTAILILKGR